MTADDGVGDSAKHGMSVLTDSRNRGVQDVFFVVCDGLKGLPDAVNAVWSDAVVQTCIIRLIRNSFRYVSRRSWDELSRNLRPIYTASGEKAARSRSTPWTTSGVAATRR